MREDVMQILAHCDYTGKRYLTATVGNALELSLKSFVLSLPVHCGDTIKLVTYQEKEKKLTSVY